MQSMTVRAKFTVTSKEEVPMGDGNGFRIKMSPVVGGSPENESFCKQWPGGSLELATVNPSAAGELVIGKEYYIDITAADEPATPAA